MEHSELTVKLCVYSFFPPCVITALELMCSLELAPGLHYLSLHHPCYCSLNIRQVDILPLKKI